MIIMKLNLNDNSTKSSDIKNIGKENCLLILPEVTENFKVVWESAGLLVVLSLKRGCELIKCAQRDD